MIAENIKKTNKSLEERGLPAGSYFEVIFKDGSSVLEFDTNWSAFSEKKEVDYFGHKMIAFVSIYPVKTIIATLNGMRAQIEDIPEGFQVYQYMRSERVLAQHIDKNNIIGRAIGLIKDDAVFEEQFINALENTVQGMRK